MLEIFRILVIALILTLIGCSKAQMSSDLIKELKNISIELTSIDTTRIKNITTPKGYKSMMDWSDSLKSKEFLYNLANNCKELNIFEHKRSGSMIYLSFGEPDETVGATGGYLNLKEINNEIKIDEFKGGK